ncbi:helix-turn-helix transcriptional regulator [Novosphingobium sp. YJ-S2-02]|uniref:Helix-turn-helix transcriptional regulator n=1 Tax=Novosphingobium aureum TaxID=2792964 RepID=A0A931HCZ3_9SPHN|nr:helix-turn-helix transcriptional regulator [Novosphingobium aureum]MBH0113208.1 helix-turn-helix transcriptional regulator [Novosphingobium aureum]
MVADRLVREPEFAKRLNQACDTNAHAPDLHRGRYVWLREELAKRFNENVSIETCRKWFAGESRPRPAKMAKVAQLLEVDVAWLSLGVDPEIGPKEKRLRNAMADGVVNVVAGLIQMDGGRPAFPDETDKRATDENIDLYAIIKGANYAFHITLGELVDDKLRFPVPAKNDAVIVLGVVREGFSVRIFEISPEIIATSGVARSSSARLDVAESDLRPVSTFAERL